MGREGRGWGEGAPYFRSSYLQWPSLLGASILVGFSAVP